LDLAMLRILSGPESQLSRRSEPGSVRRSSVWPGDQSLSRSAMTHCSNCISPISRWKYEFCATQYDSCLQKNCPHQGDNGGRKAVIRIYPLFKSVIRSSWSISRGLEVVFALVRGEAAEECSRRCGSIGLRRIVRRPFAGASSISKTSPELAEGLIGFRSDEVRGRKRNSALSASIAALTLALLCEQRVVDQNDVAPLFFETRIALPAHRLGRHAPVRRNRFTCRTTLLTPMLNCCAASRQLPPARACEDLPNTAWSFILASFQPEF
jgi:hypothetical protein